MPTEDRVRGAIDEVCEALSALDFDVQEIIGPVDVEDDEENQDSPSRYFVIVNSERGSVFILFSTGAQFAQITFPFSTAKHFATRLETSEIEDLAGVSDLADVDDGDYEEVLKQVGLEIIENTDRDALHIPRYQISLWGTSENVSYNEEVAENGFPVEFQCRRAIFPFTDNVSLREIDNRIESVLNTGSRARNYAQSAIVIRKGDSPEDYSLEAIF